MGQGDGGRYSGQAAAGGHLGVVVVDVAEAVGLTAGEGLSADGVVPDLAGLSADGHVGIGDVPLGVLPVLGVVELLGTVPAPTIAGLGVFFPAGQSGQETGTRGQQTGLLVIGVNTVPPVCEDQLRPDLADVAGEPGGDLFGALQEAVGEVVVHDRLGTDGFCECVGFGDLLPLVLGDRHGGVAAFARGEGEQYGAPAVQGILGQDRSGGQVHVTDVRADGEDRSGGHGLSWGCGLSCWSVQVDFDFEATVPGKAHLVHADVVHVPGGQCGAHLGGYLGGLLVQVFGPFPAGGTAAEPVSQVCPQHALVEAVVQDPAQQSPAVGGGIEVAACPAQH